jgi:hypothetical protein
MRPRLRCSATIMATQSIKKRSPHQSGLCLRPSGFEGRAGDAYQKRPTSRSWGRSASTGKVEDFSPYLAEIKASGQIPWSPAIGGGPGVADQGKESGLKVDYYYCAGVAGPKSYRGGGDVKAGQVAHWHGNVGDEVGCMVALPQALLVEGRFLLARPEECDGDASKGHLDAKCRS